MKYRVECEVHVGSDYEVEASSAQEAEDIAYEMFVADYGLENNYTILGFGVVKDVEEMDDEET